MKSYRRAWLLALCFSNLFPYAGVQAQQLQWVRQLGTAGGDLSLDVSADYLGNVYISGYTSGSLGGPNAGSDDAFVSKYDASGGLLWIRQLGTPDLDLSGDVSADSQGNVYICGDTYGNIGGPNAGGRDTFVSKYDASGNLQWSRQLGTTSDEESRGVSADSLGNVYLSGLTKGSLGAANAGSVDAFVSKFDSSGSLLRTRQLGTANSDGNFGVAVDSQGSVYLSGWTGGSLGGPNVGRDDAFLSKYDATGRLQWIRQLGTTNDDYGIDVSVDSLGYIYISGYTRGNLGGPNTGSIDAFVSKFDALGNLQWTRQLGTTRDDRSYGVSVDSLGNIYVSGISGGSLGGVPNSGLDDAFTSKYDASGNLQWIRLLGTAGYDRSLGVSVDSLGNVYISGYTSGSLGGPNAGSDDAFLAKFSTIPEPGTLLLATLASVALLLPQRRQEPTEH